MKEQDNTQWFFWDPHPEAFTIPGLDFSVAWYGILFALGFTLGYFLIRYIFQRDFTCSKQEATKLADGFLWYTFFGTVIGARLGHVIFYDLPYYAAHPLAIITEWGRGLASHGAALGVILALVLFTRKIRKTYPITFLRLMDYAVIPTVLIGGFIRMGNFINQEILGKESTVPWAVVFGHPADNSLVVPRHPVQLYEAAFYFLTFAVLFLLWKVKRGKLAPGVISGTFFVLTFTFRFFVEFFKMPQSQVIADDAFLTMGQYLSIPFILLGLFLLMMKTESGTKEKESY